MNFLIMQFQLITDVETSEKYYQELLVIKNLLKMSPPASVILSRSLVQRIVRSELVKNNLLNKLYSKCPEASLLNEIDCFIFDLDVVPSSLKRQIQGDLHSIRMLGNTVAHPKHYEKDVTFDEAVPIIDRLENFLSILFVKSEST